MNKQRYRVCCCAMAGTSACDYCSSGITGPTYSKTVTTTTTSIPIDIEDEDIKAVIKQYLKKVLDD